MLELIDYKPEHAEEIEIAGPNESGICRAILPDNWSELLSQSLAAKTGVFEGRVLGCGGLFEMWPGTVEAWFTMVKDIAHLPVTPKIVKRQLYIWIEELNLGRVQAPLRADWPIGIRFAEWLGFRPDGWPEVPEGVRMRQYHYDGADAIMYSIIRKRL